MSTPRRIYMDYAAGKPVEPRVAEAMLPYAKSSWGNPSSLHTLGQEAKRALEEARGRIAELINAEKKENIIFTSGATESNNMAIKGVANRNKDRGTRIITSSVEHMSVVNSCKFLTTKGFEDVFLPVNQYGFVYSFVLRLFRKREHIFSLQIFHSLGLIIKAKRQYLNCIATN